MSNRSELTAHTHRVPDVTLVSTSGARENVLRRGHALVAVILADVSCRACHQFVQPLRDVHEELTSWDADVAVITPQAIDSDAPFRFLIDPDNQFGAALGIQLPAVVVVDQWGDAKDIREAGPSHDFPDVAELIDWARFLATQCPECEGEAL